MVVLVVGGLFGRPYYRQFKERHGVSQAEKYLARGDYRSAYLSVLPALTINSNNLAALHIMARLADVAQSAETLAWWQRVVALEPTVENKLSLASAGLHYQNPPFPLTAQILGDLADTATNRAEYHVITAELALRLNRRSDGQRQLELAVQLQPTNQLFQMNLAAVRLGSADPATIEAGRATLKGFLADTNFAPQALRSLVADRLGQKDLPGAYAYSTQLLAGAQVMVGDRLQHLGILRQLHGQELPGQLQAAQLQSATNGALAAAVAGWMTVNGLATNASAWINGLGTGVRSQPPVRLALVNAYLTSSNWLALKDFTLKGDWQETDFLRLAFLSRAWSQLGKPDLATGAWSDAVAGAGTQAGSLNALLDLTGRWGLRREREELLWLVVRKFPGERGAWQELERYYYTAGNTRKLNELYATLFSAFPSEVNFKNNLIVTALLLKTNLTQAYEMAGEVFEQKPGDPMVVSTYAYALHLQGRTQEGVAALEKLNAEALNQPSVAFYYGVLLSAAGNPDKAAPYLKLARTKAQLLPEERQLLP